MASPPPPIELTVINGALLEAPVWEKHFRGQNWLAIIGIDPTCPGGLSRKWLPKANGGGYIVTGLDLYAAVEFGADYKTWKGSKIPERWYGVVIQRKITNLEQGLGILILQEYPTGREACVAAIKLRGGNAA